MDSTVLKKCITENQQAKAIIQKCVNVCKFYRPSTSTSRALDLKNISTKIDGPALTLVLVGRWNFVPIYSYFHPVHTNSMAVSSRNDRYVAPYEDDTDCCKRKVQGRTQAHWWWLAYNRKVCPNCTTTKRSDGDRKRFFSCFCLL